MARKPKPVVDQISPDTPEGDSDLPDLTAPPDFNTPPPGELNDPLPIPVPELMTVTLSVPIDTTPLTRKGYISRRVDVKMNREQALKLRCITEALDQGEACLKDGKKLRRSNCNTLLWLLDQVRLPATS